MAHGFRCKTLQQCGLRPIADLRRGFLILQCSPSLQTFVHFTAFIWLKLRCAGQSDQSCKSVGWPFFVTPRTERLGFGRILYNHWLVKIGHTHKSNDLDKKGGDPGGRSPLVKLMLTAEIRGKLSRLATRPREEENARHCCVSASLGGDGKLAQSLYPSDTDHCCDAARSFAAPQR